jgi:hypothetical protein
LGSVARLMGIPWEPLSASIASCASIEFTSAGRYSDSRVIVVPTTWRTHVAGFHQTRAE